MSDTPETYRSIWATINLRGLALMIATAGLGLVLNRFKAQGDLAWFPDWGFDVILFLVLFLFVWWAWTLPEVQAARRLTYNRSAKMLLLVLIILGAIVGAGFGAVLYWRIKVYQDTHTPPKHFKSGYAPIVPSVSDREIPFFPSGGVCVMTEAKKVTFMARIGYSQSDQMMRLVIDLPKFCEVETARYALEHREEIIDLIMADLKKAEPNIMTRAVTLDQYTILTHRHPIPMGLTVQVGQGAVLWEGPWSEESGGQR